MLPHGHAFDWVLERDIQSKQSRAVYSNLGTYLHKLLIDSPTKIPATNAKTGAMSFFNNSRNFVISDSQFITNTNISVGRNGMCGSLNFLWLLDSRNRVPGIDILLEASVPDATYDAAARHPPPSCFPGTRRQYVQDITHWASTSLHNGTLALIYWMRGPAGVGKSAVAQTCVERLKGLNQLGAAFFFSINERDDHTRFFPSIVYQLTVEFHEYRDIVDKKLSLDKTIVTKTMASQFRSLIVEPLQELKRLGRGIPTRAIFIDGLDECKSKGAQCEIIEIIINSVRNQTTPFRWAFFSRPEAHIETTFSKADNLPYCHTTYLPVSREIDGEIKLYLQAGFENLIRCRNLHIPLPWPSESQMKMLVNAAAGLFIYAATVLRFVDMSSPDPNEPLNAILDIVSGTNTTANSSHRPAFAELDIFYQLILRRIPDHSLPLVRLFLAFILLSPFRSSHGAILSGNLLRFSEAKFWAICDELHAVLHRDRPSTGHPETTSWNPYHSLRQYGAVSLYHKSFYDFLDDPARSGPFCVSSQQVKEDVFNHLLELHHDLSAAYYIQGRSKQ